MAITSYPRPGETINTDQFRDLFRVLAGGSGIVTTGALRPFGDSTGLQVKVAPGFAIIDGVPVNSTDVEVIPIDAGSGGSLSRVDALVASLDYSLSPIVKFEVLKGTPAASGAVRPSIAPSGTVVARMLIADINVGPTAATVTAGMVIDRRAILAQRVILSKTAPATTPGVPQVWVSWQ